MSKHVIETTEQVFKDSDGIERVRTTKKVVVHKMETENFYFVFTNYVQWLYGLKGVVPVKVLHYLMEHAQINTGRVSLTPGMRMELVNNLGISRGAFIAAIKQLNELGVLTKVYYTDKQTGEQLESRGEYMMNPEMLWKGDKEKRKELKVTFETIYSK